VVAPSASAASSGNPWDSDAIVTAAPKPAAPVIYDAALFKQRVGRDPTSYELANFQQFKGKGFAGEPGEGNYTIGQAAVGASETAAAIGTGALASIPAGFTYVGKLGLTLDPQAAAAASDAVQGALTYTPRTPAGQAGVQGVGDVMSAPGKTVLRAADLYDPSGNLSTMLGDIGGGVVRASGALPVAGEAAAFSRGAGVTRAVTPTVARVARSAADTFRDAPIPAGTEFNAEGVAVTPKPPAPPPAADTIGASAATPPRFESSPASVSGADTSAVEGPLNSADQAQRQATLNAVGLDDKDIRTSAVSGDKKAAATDYQQSKLDNEGGKIMADAFDKERDALGAHTDRLVADAGGSVGLDETSLHNRGQTILQPLQDLSDHFGAKIKDLYSQADAQAKGVPVKLQNTENVLGTDSTFEGNSESAQLRTGIQSRLRELGIKGDEGTILPATVQQAERLKQYLNDNWSPRTARVVSALKNAIDDDVLGAAGGNIYKDARLARATRANLLDNPQGIASLLDSSGPGGINRAVNVERVPDAVVRMPVDQFGHVVDTLQRMPVEMQPQARAALGEIRSQFMLRMAEQAQKFKGNWNAKGVTQYLSANSAKLAKVFSPSEVARMKTLNDAGNILDVDRSYPGATVQGHNLVQRGALAAIEHGAGAVGAHIAGPLGAVVGEAGGKAAAKAVGSSFSKKAARARFVKS